MKNGLAAITGLFIILSVSWLSASGFPGQATEAVGLKKVTLRIEGMT